MKQVRISLSPDRAVGPVAKEIYGGFVEHLGRNVYGGVYDPGDPRADADGFREDVIEFVRELDTPVTRYPGGCYTDGWRWEDGVGPQRPVRLDPAWGQREPNQFGLHEFMRWARKVNTEPVLTLNLSTRGILEGMELLEYCNFPGGTELSDQRANNGDPEPFNIRYWCLGNELYGRWEIGHKSAEQYAWLAGETAKAMRMLDPSVKFIFCGSPNDMDWNRTVLESCYDYVDFLSLHEVFNIKGGSPAEYLRSVDRFAARIAKAADVCESVRLLKGSGKRVKISVDEWIVWDFDRRTDPAEKWTVGPHLLEQDYTILDTLVTGEIFSMFHNFADTVALACIAQSVNVIAPIRTAPGGVSWKQGIFHPFRLTSRYGRGTALKVDAEGDLYASAVWNAEENTLALFLVNRNLTDELPLTVELEKLDASEVVEATSLHCEDLDAVNTPDEEVLKPQALPDVALAGKTLTATLPPLSWNMIRIKLATNS